MRKTLIEKITIEEIEFDENGVAYFYPHPEYMVRRAKDGYPLRKFKVFSEAKEYVEAAERGEIEIY